MLSVLALWQAREVRRCLVAAHGLPVDEALILPGEFAHKAAYQALQQHLSKGLRDFDAIFAGNDDAAAQDRLQMRKQQSGLAHRADLRTFVDYSRNTLDLNIVPAVKSASHLPIIVDPSHATGMREITSPRAGYVSVIDAEDAAELVDRMLNTDLMTRMPDHLLAITDRMSMAHGLEVRPPLMDYRLVEYAASIPAETASASSRLSTMACSSEPLLVPWMRGP